MQSLEVISVNLWQILISLCNLFIIYLVLKKILYEPVRKAVAQRRASIDSEYETAAKEKEAAGQSRIAYEKKLSGAIAEADGIRTRAIAEANVRSDKLLTDAKAKADSIVAHAENEIELEKQKATEDMRREIADVSAKIAEKLVGRTINEKDQRKLIDSFIDEVGETK